MKTVLVVDADAKAGALIARAIRRRGFDVANAASGDAALQTVTAIQPTAIVVVLEPPEAGSWLPLVHQLSEQRETHDIPVIVARCDGQSLLAEAQRCGNVAVLLGDCAPETLATEVDRVVLESADPSAARTRLTFPVLCPKCGERAGMPRSVSTAAHCGTYISLSCEKCAQQWWVLRQADTPGFARL